MTSMAQPSQLAKNIAAAKQNSFYDAFDADLVLLSSGDSPQLFKVYKNQLAGVFTVFRDMLDLGATSSDTMPPDEPFCGLPVVQLAETTRTLLYFLDYSSNNVDSFPDAAQMNWDLTIDVWEACIRYDIALAQALLKSQISSDIAAKVCMSASFTIEQAFKLYTIACRAQRHSLIEKMSKLIGGYDPRDWPGAMAMALSGEDLFRLTLEVYEANRVRDA